MKQGLRPLEVGGWRQKKDQLLNEIFRRKKLFSRIDAQEVRNRCVQIDRKLNGLINSLRGTKGLSFQQN